MIFVGIDVAKDKHDCFILNSEAVSYTHLDVYKRQFHDHAGGQMGHADGGRRLVDVLAARARRAECVNAQVFCCLLYTSHRVRQLLPGRHAAKAGGQCQAAQLHGQPVGLRDACLLYTSRCV